MCYKNNMSLKHTVCLVTLLMLHVASRVDAQESVPFTGTVEREIAAGTTHSYTLPLTSGEYVAGVVVQRGIGVVATIYEPSGSRVRHFTAPREGRVSFNVAADQTGTYRLELRAPDVSATQGAIGSYQLSVTEKLSLDERLRSTPSEERYKSRTIEQLRAQLATGDADTERFWQTVRQSGAPLVEAIDGDPTRMLVTFLWRGDASTRSVGVWGIVFGGPPSEYQLRRLATSDVWYLTQRLPAGSRFTYGFSPNAPVGPEFGSARFQQRVATMQRDPWNPLREPGCPADATRYECPSMAELPGAASQPWTVRNPMAPTGDIRRHTLRSDILKNERAISVYIPPGYRADGPPSGLLVVLDGPAYLGPVPTPTILDNLLAAKKIAPVVAVFVANASGARARELPPNPAFAEFLATELLPWVHAHYTVSSDPRRTVIAGSSFGGLAATYAGLRHSELFGNVLCQSGSFWWAPDRAADPNPDATTETGWLAKEFIKSPTKPLRFWMEAGLLEVDSRGTGGVNLETSRHMRDVLLAKGYEVQYSEFAGGHEYLNFRGTLAEGLIALIGTAPSP
jgi:enterochelin esterase family protein